MNEIEQRIRAGLDVEVPASPDVMIGAAAAGVQRYRRRRNTAIASLAAASVAVAVAIGVAASGGTPDAPPKPIETPKKEVEPPSPQLVLDDLQTDGNALYLTTRGCPVALIGTRCLPREGFWNGRYRPVEKAAPVTLWRYADQRWERLGAPGANSFAKLMVLPHGLVFVPLGPETGNLTRGPLRVSVDGGRNWADWRLPFGSGEVVVAEDYVIATSSRSWVRRNITAGGWEDITPPRRKALYDYDRLGWGVVALADSRLIATANNFMPEAGGGYRVSDDFGSTWSRLRSNPGEGPGHGSSIASAGGSTAYAECWELVPGYGGDSSRGCGYYRSDDLVHWTKVDEVLPDDVRSVCTRPRGATWAFTEIAVRSGGAVYEIANVPVVNGRPATRKELDNLDMPHRVRHVLEVSTDDCATWRPLIP